ncbi:MAG: hypothetical protein CMN30_19580 [Sandaracinus sp.]|nr:hypothetical protein [Sandaracinus sp.]
MSESLRQRLVPALLALALLALLLVRIGSFGIWDPWELNAADAARNLLDGEGVAWNRPPLGTWLISTSFDLFGVSEWSGRFPAVLGGVLVLLGAFVYARRFGDGRAGLFALVVAGTTPLFLFNSRQMLGDAVAMGTTGLVGLAAAMVALRPQAAETPRRRFGWPVLLAVAIPLAVLAGGVLQGVLPPLLAVGGVALFRPIAGARPRLIGGTVVTVLALLGIVLVAQAVFTDAAGYSLWLGGAPRGGNPPGFDTGLELVFHAFAPWSALILIALAALLRPGVDAEAADGAPITEGRLVLVLWAALAYGVQVLFTSRYGPTTYLAVVPLAAATALFLRDVEQSGRAWWSEAVIGALFVGLLIRDFALYPSSPIDGLPLEGVEVPEIFNPRTRWAAVLGLFALGIILAFIGGEDAEKPTVRATVGPWLKDRWKRGGAFRVWTALGVLFLGASLIFGAICWIGGTSLPLASIGIRVGKALAFLPVLVAVALFGIPWALYGARKLAATRWRMAPLLLAGAVVGAYASQGFLPELSAHFSPREVYDTYNELRADGEPLGEFQVSGRAAAYYAEGEVQELATQGELLEFLGADARRWAVVPTDELPALNRAYRAQESRHLFVADARSARMLLVTNQAIEGRENQNFLQDAVLDSEPEVQHRVGGKFDDRIELIGYDLDTPQEGFVGAGQEVTVTWYWRALNRIPGSYQIFLHVDGMGNRMNGDHEPVDGKYPVRLWDEGDIIVDRQVLRVPANYRPGPYTFWIGFYSGSSRLPVTEGPEDDADRLRAGIVRVR